MLFPVNADQRIYNIYCTLKCHIHTKLKAVVIKFKENLSDSNINNLPLGNPVTLMYQYLWASSKIYIWDTESDVVTEAESLTQKKGM